MYERGLNNVDRHVLPIVTHYIVPSELQQYEHVVYVSVVLYIYRHGESRTIDCDNGPLGLGRPSFGLK